MYANNMQAKNKSLACNVILKANKKGANIAPFDNFNVNNLRRAFLPIGKKTVQTFVGQRMFGELLDNF